jgi:predicted phage replisome organizer
MSVRDSKRYFWLKLKDDFFDDDAIEWLEEQPNGKEYVLFYLKLCLKSLKHDCCLIRTVGNMLIPYDAKKLGELTRTKEDTVIVALELLKRIGLVDIQENGALFMAKVSEMIGSETNAAARMRKTREKAKELGVVNNVRQMLQICSPEKEIEKDIEIEKEKESTPSLPQEVLTEYQNKIYPMPKGEVQSQLAVLTEEYGTKRMMFAISKASERGARNIGYIAGILKNWNDGDSKQMRESEPEEQISGAEFIRREEERLRKQRERDMRLAEIAAQQEQAMMG